MYTHIYLCTGSNIGDRQGHLNRAVELLNELAGNCVAQSPVYVTDPWGLQEQDIFFNQILELRSEHGPEKLLEIILDIEIKMGRKREMKWGPRAIDIDIIFFGNQIINAPGLKVPHPEMQNRRFVLAPLNDIAPNFVHPVIGKTISELLAICEDPLHVAIKP